MYLRDQGIGTLGKTRDRIQTLNDGKFPERLGQVQGSCVEPCGLNAELSPVARLRQPNVPNMKLQVEVLVLHPVGMIQIKRNLHHLLPKGLGKMQALADEVQNILEPLFLTLDGGRVIDHHAADMHRTGGGFGVKKRSVLACHLLHLYILAEYFIVIGLPLRVPIL